MKQSTVYHAMTLPALIGGVPRDYLAFAFAVSLLIGGLGGMIIFKNGLAALLGAAHFALIFWVIGYFMTKRDPEFFGVWIRNCFQIGQTVALDGKRSYEP
ncbi:VirB3 family type IV secretion system protein [Vibrio ordalii]|uniref:VirB3 family type IV secretion system protein n=1 Tax=Vibrio ordalii TaxID=28174 RepID=UPI00024835C4|nr:VirB3 family type IV secretion system protein [Vibrio ordalii]